MAKITVNVISMASSPIKVEVPEGSTVETVLSTAGVPATRIKRNGMSLAPTDTVLANDILMVAEKDHKQGASKAKPVRARADEVTEDNVNKIIINYKGTYKKFTAGETVYKILQAFGLSKDEDEIIYFNKTKVALVTKIKEDGYLVLSAPICEGEAPDMPEEADFGEVVATIQKKEKPVAKPKVMVDTTRTVLDFAMEHLRINKYPDTQLDSVVKVVADGEVEVDLTSSVEEDVEYIVYIKE